MLLTPEKSLQPCPLPKRFLSSLTDVCFYFCYTRDCIQGFPHPRHLHCHWADSPRIPDVCVILRSSAQSSFSFIHTPVKAQGYCCVHSLLTSHSSKTRKHQTVGFGWLHFVVLLFEIPGVHLKSFPHLVHWKKVVTCLIKFGIQAVIKHMNGSV